MKYRGNVKIKKYDDISELHKKYRLNEEKEIYNIISDSPKNINSRLFRSFAENVERQLMLNFDAFISESSYLLNTPAVKIEPMTKVKGQAKNLVNINKFGPYDNIYVKLVEQRGMKVAIEVKNREKKNIRIALANFYSPLITEINIKVGKGATLKLFEIFLSDSKKESLNLSLHKINVGEDSNVEINTLHNESKETRVIHFSDLLIKKNSRARFNIVYEGGKNYLVRNYTNTKGHNAYFELNSTIIGSNNQQFDVFNSFSNSKQATSHVGETKVVLSGKSSGFIKDMSEIKPGAKGAETHIKERAIIVGREANVSLLPDMSIKENDIIATHSAASAPLDEENIFYLMSKGLERHKSESMLIRGFLADIINKIEETTAKSIIISHVYEKTETGEFGKLVKRDLTGAWINKLPTTKTNKLSTIKKNKPLKKSGVVVK